MNEKIKEFRQEIAKLEKEQRELKPQRKTVNGRPENATVNPYTAAEMVRSNKYELRMMYAAYGLMRGRKFNEIENKAKPLVAGSYYDGMYVAKELDNKHPLFLYLRDINEYLNKYGYELPTEKKTNRWGDEIKSFFYDRDEEAVCVSEQQA